MFYSPALQTLLGHYSSDNPGSRTQLARLFSHGRLAGTGRLLILAVDQGFEHGPARSFSMNPPAYDPCYHFRLAIQGGLSALAAPLGFLQAGAAEFAGLVPLILKMNSSNSLSKPEEHGYDLAITGSVQQALALGCVGVGLTIYPGSDQSLELYEEVQDIIAEAKAHGLLTIVWSYPRGGDLRKKEDQKALDVIAYGAHIAALLGAHIIKVKLPLDHMAYAPQAYATTPTATLESRIQHVMTCAFQGRRVVIFSGEETKSTEDLVQEAGAIKRGGGFGSIIGRNLFQRSEGEALDLMDRLVAVYAA